MSLLPQGESLRKAVRFISDERQHNPKRAIQAIVEEACAKYNLSPKDAEFLTRYVRQENL